MSSVRPSSAAELVKGRILCLADIRGRISTLNELATEAGVEAIIHTGDFGLYDASSLERINERTLRHLLTYSPLVSPSEREKILSESQDVTSLRAAVKNSSNELISDFPKLLSGALRLSVPVYTVWGACEDVAVVEKIRSGQYHVDNLHILDEATSRSLDIGGIKLRLLGLGGALVPHKMFDNGDGRATIAGGQGMMWTTALQIGELVDTAQRTYDQSETRLFVSHAAPGREGIMAQLGLVLKADLTISAGLHFRYGSSYNEFSVQYDMDGLRQKLANGRTNFHRIWDSVKTQVEAVIDDNQRVLLEKFFSVIERVPLVQSNVVQEEPAWKNCWNWNLSDASYGHLILHIKEGRVSSELKSQGFNFAYRRKTPASASPKTGPELSKTSEGQPIPSSGAIKDEHHGSNGNAALPASPRSKLDKEHTDALVSPQSDSVSVKADVANAASPLSNSIARTLPQPPSKSEDNNGSPPADGRSPPTKKRHNPYTLFISGLGDANEAELRAFFGEAANTITTLKIRPGPKPVAFVEFGSQEDMDIAVNSHSKTLKDVTPRISVAEDRSGSREVDGRGRGFRGSRGGRGRGDFGPRGRGRGDSGAPNGR